MEGRQHIDLLTVIAIAAIAYAVANITHEIIGHCGMALVVGTKCTVISSTYIPLETFLSNWKYSIIVVAGCAANFAVGLICFVILRRSRSRVSGVGGRGSRQEAQEGSWDTGAGRRGIAEPTTRYLLWLLMAVNLFLASTYIAVAPIIKFGDSYILIQDLSPQIFWRPAVALAGGIAWWFSFRVCRFQLARLIGAKDSDARQIAWKLLVPAYLTGGVLTVASALFSRIDWRIAQLEAAGGTFGLTIWFLLLPFFLPQIEMTGREPLSLPRSFGWIMAGALTAVIFVGVLGRGIDL